MRGEELGREGAPTKQPHTHPLRTPDRASSPNLGWYGSVRKQRWLAHVHDANVDYVPAYGQAVDCFPLIKAAAG